jgi:hypothetical protein
MVVVPDSSVGFDEATISAMGVAFERACTSLQTGGIATTVREIIAMRILEAAAQGERDPVRLHDQALKAFDIEKPPVVPAV